MKHLKALICLMAIAMSFASCNDDDSNDDPKKMSDADKAVVAAVNQAVNDAIDGALNPPAGKILGKIMFAEPDGPFPYENDSKTLKITGSMDDMTITMTGFSSNPKLEDGSTHRVVINGTLLMKTTENHEAETRATEMSGTVEVTFDGAAHNIVYAYTETEDHSGDGKDIPYTKKGKITFDGTEYTVDDSGTK